MWHHSSRLQERPGVGRYASSAKGTVRSSLELLGVLCRAPKVLVLCRYHMACNS
jgi:hypothetical protein